MESFAETVRRLRLKSYTRRRLSFQTPTQVEFAYRFGLSPGALRDAEQGRVEPSRAMRVLVAAIELDPILMEKAAALAMDRWEREPTGGPSKSDKLARARVRPLALYQRWLFEGR